MLRGPQASVDPRTWFGPEDLPWFEQDGWRERASYLAASPVRQRQIEELRRTGSTVLRAAVPKDLCDATRASLLPHFQRTGAARLPNAAWALEPVRRIAASEPIIDLLAFAYGRRPIPFQTLDFRTGTEQEAHRDEVHFDSLPPRFMCGVWVALEDIGEDQGPVAYAPGSHRQPRSDESPAAPLTAFCASAGDALIWSSALLHGGAPIGRPDATRWSQVTHYVFDGCIWYTPIRSDPGIGRLELRLPLLDVRTLRRERPVLDGRPARFVHGRGRQATVVPPSHPRPSWFQRRAWRSVRPLVTTSTQAWWARAARRPPVR